MKPETVIQQQVDAYNNRDIEAFVSCHSPTIKLYNFPKDYPFCNDLKQLRNIYTDIFDQSLNLHSKIMNRIVMGDTVIDHELITGRKGVDPFELIAIYEVRDEFIVKAYFKR